MQDLTDLYGAAEEPTSENIELGKLGMLMNGILEAFRFRGLWVRRHGDSIRVYRKYQKGAELGGFLYAPSASLLEAHEWLKAKAALYGGGSDGSA